VFVRTEVLVDVTTLTDVAVVVEAGPGTVAVVVEAGPVTVVVEGAPVTVVVEGAPVTVVVAPAPVTVIVEAGPVTVVVAVLTDVDPLADPVATAVTGTTLKLANPVFGG